jgi:hypothetical protein
MSAQKTQRDCQTAQEDANKETKIRGKSQIIRLVCSLVPFLLIKSDMNNSRKWVDKDKATRAHYKVINELLNGGMRLLHAVWWGLGV